MTRVELQRFVKFEQTCKKSRFYMSCLTRQSKEHQCLKSSVLDLRWKDRKTLALQKCSIRTPIFPMPQFSLEVSTFCNTQLLLRCRQAAAITVSVGLFEWENVRLLHQGHLGLQIFFFFLFSLHNWLSFRKYIYIFNVEHMFDAIIFSPSALNSIIFL